MAEGEQGRHTGLATAVSHRAFVPVDVFSSEHGDVGLCAAQVPEQLIVSAGGGIPLASDDFLMLFGSDGSLFFVSNAGPVEFWKDRPGQPIHPNRIIVGAAKINVGGDRAVLENRQELLSGGLDDFAVADQVKGLIL